jgi:hypothetical protein
MTHPFEKSGLGKAPFHCTGVSENVFALPDGNGKAGGCCDYCFTGIRWEFWLESADQKTFKVGCDCVAKIGWGVERFEVVRAEHVRARRQAGAQKRRDERQAQFAAQRAQQAAERIEATQAWRDDNSALVARLQAYSGTNDFLLSSAGALKHWGSLTARHLEAVVSCFAGIDRHAAAIVSSQHFGYIGDKVTLTLTVERIIVLASQFYAANYIVICRDESGNVISYKGRTALGAVGDTNTVKASIKEHTVYNGVKQTVIQRPKLV